MTVGADAPIGVSRRLRRFEDEAHLAPEEATDHLRTDLTAMSGPLVEPLADRAGGDVLVTFIWVGEDGPVSLRAQLLDRPGVLSHVMSRVEGTDVWYLSSILRRDLRLPYQFVIRDHWSDSDLLRNLDYDDVLKLDIEVIERGFADPHNPDRIPPLQGPDDELPPPENWASVLTLPDAPREPQLYAPRPAGRELASHLFRSAVFGNERAVTIYAPPRQSIAATGPLALLVLFDGEWWLRVAELPSALDNLHAKKLIPPTAVVFVHNATRTSRMTEMPCEPLLPTMLADELLPMVRASHSIDTRPERSVIGGASRGGLAAAYVAFRRPDLFGNVLSCSGSYWWGLANDPSEPFRWGCDDEPEWLTRQYAQAERKPIRFWMDVGVLERGMLQHAPGLDMLSVNRHMRTVLQAKGYDVTYYEAPGGHDFATWRLTALAGLQALLSSPIVP